MPLNNRTPNPEQSSDPFEIPPFDASPDTAFEGTHAQRTESGRIEKEYVRPGAEDAVQQALRRPVASPVRSSSPAGVTKSPVLLGIERVLEEDMRETFERMDAPTRLKFKIEGEKTARTIERLMQETTVKAGKIFNLILHWLKIIPGVNTLFLRQEAKIKTDHILNLKK